MSDLFICIDCELANANADPTPLNEHGMCPRCGSSSVVPVDTLLELDAKAKAAKQAPPSGTPDYTERAKAMREQRKRDSAPLVDFFKKKFPLTLGVGAEDVASFHRTLDKWDGWAWHSYHPWEEDNPVPGHYTIELIQGVKNGPRWLIKIDLTIVNVSQFQDGMN